MPIVLKRIILMTYSHRYLVQSFSLEAYNCVAGRSPIYYLLTVNQMHKDLIRMSQLFSNRSQSVVNVFEFVEAPL